jgi:hypothetical protein
MRKLRLDVEVLRVQSFATQTTGRRGGTVRGNWDTGTTECLPSQMIGCEGSGSSIPVSGACFPETVAGPSCLSRCGENVD